MVRHGIAVLTSVCLVATASAGPLVFTMRQPLPDIPKHRGFFTCTSELNRAVGQQLAYIEPRHSSNHMDDSRYYRINAVVKAPQRYVRIYAGCTTSRDGRDVLGIVIGHDPFG